MNTIMYFDNYSPVGDLTVVATCLVIFILLGMSYVNKTKSLGIYITLVIYLIIAALLDVIQHEVYLSITDGDYMPVYIIRLIYHTILFMFLLLYVVYIVTLQRLEKDKRTVIMIISCICFFASIIAEFLISNLGYGLYIDPNGVATRGINVFRFGYIAFMVIITYVLVVYRKRLYRRVMMSIYGSLLISFLILFQQGRHGQISYTVVSFMFPAIAMLYLVHSNPYDIEIGSVSKNALEDTIRYNHKRKHTLLYMSLYLPDFEGERNHFPKSLQDTIRYFSIEFFKDATLFQISGGHIILVARESKNPDYKTILKKILDAFKIEYERYKYDYKIVFGKTIDEISEKNAYINFIKSIHHNMNMNEIHFVDEDDIIEFNEYEYIMAELIDIYKKNDLDDPRVLVYCQPVWNLRKQLYDTAEALMRLDLPQYGIVEPGRFIHLAEKYGFIHVLTRIILKKTCDNIRKLLAEGYIIKRISVNVSIQEMHLSTIKDEILNIIHSSGIPEKMIAIELTESQTDYDFLVLKEKIEELKALGIKFYLDDFGTGYSNIERILELPFDIIKFDRSLVIASNSNSRSCKMVGNLANMFSELNYAVLYEGIENEKDEKRCIDMSAKYLQGYKYSKPIPMERLEDYFTKEK